jgi:hypothetical protein
MRAAVRTLNEGGHSWDEIAAALGKPKQNVWRKYADPVRALTVRADQIRDAL